MTYRLTCRLTACTLGSGPGPTFGVEYGKPLYLYLFTVLFYNATGRSWPSHSLNNYIVHGHIQDMESGIRQRDVGASVPPGGVQGQSFGRGPEDKVFKKPMIFYKS